MIKIKESTLRKLLINRVLDLDAPDLVGLVNEYGLGSYATFEVDWDVKGGHQAIGIETLPNGEERDRL